MFSSAQTVSFVFETRYVTQNVDERLAISGSINALGNWNFADAILGKEIPRNSGRWLVAVELPENIQFEWKWLVISKKKTQVFRWEERPNRSLTSGTRPTHVRSVWNLGEETEIPIKHKFQRLGSSGSDSEEEWSYLPSQDLFKSLCQDEDEDSSRNKPCENNTEEKSNSFGILDYFRRTSHGTDNVQELNSTEYSSPPTYAPTEICQGSEREVDLHDEPSSSTDLEKSESTESNTENTGRALEPRQPFIRRVGGFMCWFL